MSLSFTVDWRTTISSRRGSRDINCIPTLLYWSAGPCLYRRCRSCIVRSAKQQKRRACRPCVFMHLQSTHAFIPTKPLQACTIRTCFLVADSSLQRSRASYYRTTHPSQRMDSHRGNYGFQHTSRVIPRQFRYRWLGMTAHTGYQSFSFGYSAATVQKNMLMVAKNKNTQASKGVCKERAGISYSLSFPQKHIPLPSQVGSHICLVGRESQTK